MDTITFFNGFGQEIDLDNDQKTSNKLIKTDLLVGPILGDILGSTFEHNNNLKFLDFSKFPPDSNFTDDSVMTVATMDCLLRNGDFAKYYQNYGRKYPYRGYGTQFQKWLDADNPAPYNSFGNGSAMRVSPIGIAGQSLEEVLDMAKQSAQVSHNHPEGIKGAQAIASAVFLAKQRKSKEEIKQFIEENFHYNLHRSINDIRLNYHFDSSCQGSCPEAIIAFLESKSFEDSIKLAISLGGDSDTIACMAGGISQAYYQEIPEYMLDQLWQIVPLEMRKTLEEFSKKYPVN